MMLRLPKSRFLRALIYVTSALLVLLAIDLFWVRMWRHISVSTQTTSIVEPLKSDGTPDYLRYLEDRAREGVTVDNNAMIPLLQSIAPEWRDKDESEPLRPEYYQKLGIALPARPVTLIRYGRFLQSRHPGESLPQKLFDEESSLRTHPWSAADHPDASAWIDAHAAALDALPAITDRTRIYLPMIPSYHDMLISVPIPHVSAMKFLGQLAVTRAMRNVHDKKFAEAQVDLLAAHRLARLSAQGWTVIDYLIALVIERDVTDADLAFAGAPGLTAEQLHQFTKAVNAPPRWPEKPPAFEFERYEVLDSLQWLCLNPQSAGDLLNNTRPIHDTAALNRAGLTFRPANFNAAAADANIFFDHYHTSFQAATILERERQTAQVDADMALYARKNGGWFGDPARQVLAVMIPSMATFATRHDMRCTAETMLPVALALFAARADIGQFPDTLQTLVPKYVAAIPPDPYGTQLKYRKTAEGFVLYSIGPNQKDDSGKKSDTLDGGDIVIQFP